MRSDIWLEDLSRADLLIKYHKELSNFYDEDSIATENFDHYGSDYEFRKEAEL